MICKTKSNEPKYSRFHAALVEEIRTLDTVARWHAIDPTEAEELLQDTCLLALRFKDSYRHGSNLRGWLLRIMRNRHISLKRRESLKRRVYETEGQHALTEWSIGESSRLGVQSTSMDLFEGGLSDEVLAAVRDLLPEFREAVWMCDVVGLSYADVAKKLGRPIGTIMSRIHRGRKALREQLISREHLAAA